MKIAVIDLETTGLNPFKDEIIEIGLVFVDNFEIVSTYTQLFKPGVSIPSKITALTGISNPMVARAPLIIDKATELLEMTQGYVLAGHHVQFDYSFLKQTLKRLDINFSAKTICTAELARLFFPSRKSYSLKSICANLGIVNENAHRALSDAKATASILLRMSTIHGMDPFSKMIKKRVTRSSVPLRLISDKINALPTSTGVYYLLKKDKKPLYIGKAKNIKSRLESHFRGDGNSLKLLAVADEIHEIKFRETGSEIIASLIEDHEIRHFWPKYNHAQKVNNKKFGIVFYIDMNHNYRMAIASTGKLHCFEVFFHKYSKAVEFVIAMVKKYDLNPGLSGLPVNGNLDAATHNSNFKKMINDMQQSQVVEVFCFNGRNESELSYIFIEDLIYKGIGFIEKSRPCKLQHFQQHLQLMYSSISVENIIHKIRQKRQPDFVFVSKKTSPEYWNGEVSLQS